MNTYTLKRSILKYLSIVGLLLLLPIVGLAQPCGCTTCPEDIPTISDFEVCFDVQGISVDDLSNSNQGVCGVSLEWSHDYIENLSLTLRSPGGQEVQLVGPGVSGASSISTAGARWDLSFEQCTESVFPFPGTGPQFSGSNTNWIVLGNYSGSYYPFSGCLEDFNTGPVNGQWCLRIQSDALSTFRDRLFDFSIDFCDDAGSACCEAQVPVLSSAVIDTVLCGGDSSLYQEVIRSGSGLTDYLSRLLVTRNDSVFQYSLDSFDLRGASPGTYQVCPVEYWSGDANVLPAIGEPFLSFLDSVASLALCAELANECHQIVIVPSPGLTVIDTSICENQTLLFDGLSYSAPGTYPLAYTSVGQCDSLVELRLSFNRRDSAHYSATLCDGDTILLNGVRFTSAGDFRFDETNQLGCDSIITYSIESASTYTFSRDTAFCAGQSLIFGADTIRAAGNYDQQFSTTQGCDSIIRWGIIALNPTAEISATDTILTCANPALTLEASVSTTPIGIQFTRRWRGPNGPISGGFNVVVSQAGWYYLEHSEEINGTICTAIDSILITQNTDAALVSSIDSLQLTCSSDSVDLIAVPGNATLYTYEWSLSGSIVALDSVTRVGTSGTYQLIATRVDNSCSDTSYTDVVDRTTLPQLLFDLPDTITCIRDTVLLNAQASLMGSTIVTWRRDGSANTLSTTAGIAVARAPGRFVLHVMDLTTGCADSSFVDVFADTSQVQLLLDQNDTLNCFRDSVEVNATANRPSLIEWFDETNALIGTGSSIYVRNPMKLTIRAVAMGDGCQTEEDFDVSVDTTKPTAVILRPDTLRCFPPIAVLDASLSTGRSNLDFFWETTSTTVVAGVLSPRLSTSGGGDYAVIVTDPISGCSDTATTTLVEDRAIPTADAGFDQMITCTNSTVMLGSGNSSVGDDISYRWRAVNGFGLIGIPDGPLAIASAEGDYILTVINEITGCRGTDTVSVSRSLDVPIVVVTDTVVIACGQSSSPIGSTGSSQGTNYQYRWSTADGEMLADSLLPEVIVGAAGIYRLTITDLSSNCSAFAEAVVIETCPATVLTTGTDTINCYTGPRIRLSATGTNGPGNLIHWSTNNGLILSDEDTYSPLISGPGWYYATATQSFSSSIAIDSVLVSVDTIAPIAVAGANRILSCTDVTNCIELNGSGSTYSSNSIAAWSTIGGNFCSDTLGFVTRVNGPGLYELMIIDTLNGCSDISLLSVDVDQGVPTPNAGNDQILLCESDSLTLYAQLPSDLSNLSYWWIDNSGLRLSDTLVDSLVVYQAGVYGFVQFDSTSSCQAVDSVVVIQQLCAPNARPVVSGPLSCIDTTVTLSTPIQSGMNASWTLLSPAGPTLGGFSVEVNVSGTYQLVIFDPVLNLSDTAQVTVRDLSLPPVARVSPSQPLTCVVDTVNILGNGSFDPLGGMLLYRWIGAGVISDSTQMAVEVAQAGVLELVVQSTISGCLDTASVVIQVDTIPPIAVAETLGELNCQNQSLQLSGSNSSGAGLLSFDWSSLDGYAVSGSSTTTPVVTQPGDYRLSVTDATNGCTASDTVTVFQLNESYIDAGVDTSLSCITGSVALSPTLLNRPGSVVWTKLSQGGACISDPNILNPIVNCEGDYILTWTDDQSGCSYSDTVRIERRPIEHGLTIVGDTVLTCSVDTVSLIWNANPGIQVSWGGSTISSDTLAVANPGVVSIFSLDQDGCRDTISLEVTLDTISPVAFIDQPDTLTCIQTELLLSAEDQSGEPFEVEWSTPGGFSAGPDLRAGIPGDYSAIVTRIGNQCTDTFRVRVLQDTVAPVVLLDVPLGTTLDCNIEELEIVASVNPQESRLIWVGPAGQQLDDSAFRQNIRIPGIYQLSAFHPRTGCSGSAVEVIQDSGTPLTDYTLETDGILGCDVDEVSINAELPPDVVVNFSDAIGNPVNSNGISSAMVVLAFLQDTITGCRTIDSVSIEEFIPLVDLYFEIEDSITCDVSQVDLAQYLPSDFSTDTDFVLVSPTGDSSTVLNQSSFFAGVSGTWTLVAQDQSNGCFQVSTDTLFASGDAIQNVEVGVVDATCPDERDGLIEVLAVEGGTAPFTFSIEESQNQVVGQFGLLTGGVYDLTVVDANGCQYSLDIIVNQASVKEVLLPEIGQVPVGDTICVTPIIEGGRADSLQWRATNIIGCDTCESLCVLAEAAGVIGLEVYFDGCVEEVEVPYSVFSPEPVIWPTAFSPNGDGVNDAWKVEVISGRVARVRVFDRWGSMLFSTVGNELYATNPWDGFYNGKPVNPAVYVVEVQGFLEDGTPYTRYGDVAVVR